MKKNFYVSAIDGPARFLVAGPYSSHDVALARVDAVKEHANKADPRAWFMAWGTAGSDDAHTTPLGAF